MTLRASGGPGGHLCSQTRLDNAINAFWTSRDEWWIHSAEDRMRWRLHGDKVVEATAPPTRGGDYTEVSQLQENTNPSSGSVGASRQEPSASEAAGTDRGSALSSAESRCTPSDPPALEPLLLSWHRTSPPAFGLGKREQHRTE